MIKTIYKVCVVLLFTSNIAFAEDAKDVIAVVDVEKVVLESLAGKDLSKKLEAKMTKFQQKYSDKETNLQKERDSLQKKQAILSKEVFEKEVRDFQNKAQEMQKTAQAERMEIEKQRASSMEEIDVAAKAITKDVANEKGFKIVVPIATVLYYDSKLDVTEEILKRLDKKITKVKFEDKK